MDISAKPKKKTLKEKWNNSGKNIFLKVLHAISYVLSAVFIFLNSILSPPSELYAFILSSKSTNVNEKY